MITRKLIEIDEAYKALKKVETSNEVPIKLDNSKLLECFNNFKINKDDFAIFYHELCPYTDPKDVFKLGQTEDEKLVFDQYTGSKLSVESLVTINNILTQSDGKLRQGDLLLNSYRYNEQIKFPDAATAQTRLYEIIKIINEQKELSLKDAICVYVLLLNSHAFTDGNGRLARVVFNLLTADSTSSYLPIYEIKEMSLGGYEIRLRKAEILNDWQPICTYFENCINLCEKFNQKK